MYEWGVLVFGNLLILNHLFCHENIKKKTLKYEIVLRVSGRNEPKKIFNNLFS